MKHLVTVELLRLRWRRAVLLLTCAALLVPALIFAATAWNTRPVSDSELRYAQEQVERERNAPYVARELRRCEAKPENYGLTDSGDELAAACEQQILPRAEWFLPRVPLDLAVEHDEGSGIAIAVVLTMLVLLMGTTFVGHDWNSGSMSNQLLFEPRRLRVWAAKGAVVFLAGLTLAGVVLVAHWTGLWLLSEQRGIAVPDGAVADGFRQTLRAALLAAFAGLGGYALTMLFRSTVATLGILFAVSIAAPLLLSVLAFQSSDRLMPQNNYAAVVLGGIESYDYDHPCPVEGDDETRYDGGCPTTITTGDGATYFGVLLLAAGGLSLLSFGRRDVP
ncbi:hypothetical protein [Nocardioides sp.]|uniref:hypothetical protein n=1 Tax=Nocardioides sp. TaxID=35761 RepID=UPI0035698D96